MHLNTQVFDIVENEANRKPVAVFVCGPEKVVQSAWDESTGRKRYIQYFKKDNNR